MNGHACLDVGPEVPAGRPGSEARRVPPAATPSTPPGHRPPPGLAATARAGRTGTEQSASCHAVPDAWGASACPSEGRTRWIALAGGHSTPTKKGRQFLSPQTVCMGHTRATRHATPQRAANVGSRPSLGQMRSPQEVASAVRDET